ncbi:glyoxalase [Microvirga aerilata]|uniref:Glyoxalase n=1 Tax=Microvirga aerilata TaxID=670292 RepID=A0A936ZAC5_9HYPH|nr:glyoxalase [Microvirga aerilata]MBL0402754.1 glyoxalase [Microvirga aerilata]
MLRLDHVQLAIPKGAEDQCGRLYVDLLGMKEAPKPSTLAGRGGLWLESGPVRIHLGVEEKFSPARKAHPAVATGNLDGLAQMLSEAGCEPTWDDAIPEVRRFFVSDPVGNRIEFL